MPLPKRRWMLLLPLLLIAGCFPIELDVSPDGKMVISRQEGFFVFDPASGKVTKVGAKKPGSPVFARFSPDGKNVLTVIKNGSVGFSDAFEFHVVPLAGGKERMIYKTGNAAYVRYSPDGKNLGVVKISEKKRPPLDDTLPELQLVSVDRGTSKLLSYNVSHLCRWFKDSKRILTLHVESKDKKTSHFSGHMVSIDVATGKATNLAAITTQKEHFFDISPDNKKVLFTALQAGKPGEKLPKIERGDLKLYELDVASGAIRKIDKKADYAIYSPDGKQVLIGTAPEGFSFDTLNIEIADAALKAFTVVARDAHKEFSIGGGGIIYPGWQSNSKIYYFVERKIYGTEGKGLYLTMVGADGKGRRVVQPIIDAAAVIAE